jgi:multidrug efflux pump subunit AcrA (membrane-fusion protein)
MSAFSTDAAAAAVKPKPRTGRIISIIVLLLAIAGIAYGIWSREHSRVPQAVRVRVLSPKPAAVYRWFSAQGTVTDHEGRTLAFESAGTLAELLPPGTSFVAGDILGRLRGAQPIEALHSRHRARLAFYQQMRDSMRAANNLPELRQAEIKLAEKQRLIDESVASLAKLVVRATEPGEIVETLAKVGTPVKANAPLVRVKGRMLHGEFELEPDEIASAGKLGFCRVEVVGLGPRASNAEAAGANGTAADVGSPDAQAVPRFVDCTIEPAAPPAKKLRVAQPDNLGLVPGQPLRLARHRYDAVFPVPAPVVSGAAEHRTIWIASAGGTAERRDVVVADVADDALVSEGLRVGDEVIVDAPADLHEGAAIVVER